MEDKACALAWLGGPGKENPAKAGQNRAFTGKPLLKKARRG